MSSSSKSLFVVVALSSLGAWSAVKAQPTGQEIASRQRRIRDGRTPQLPDREALFERATPIVAPGYAGPIACRIEVPRGRYDGLFRRGAFTRPDLLGRLTVSGRRHEAFTRMNSFTGTFTVPDAVLKKGEPVRLDVVEVDAMLDDSLGNDTRPYAGRLPVGFEGRRFEAECRALDREELEAELPEILDLAEPAVAEGERFAIDLRTDDYHQPPEALGRATYHLYDAAARVGWNDPRVRPLWIRQRHARSRFRQAVRLALRWKAESSPQLGRSSRLRGLPIDVRVVGVDHRRETRERLDLSAGMRAVGVMLTTDDAVDVSDVEVHALTASGPVPVRIIDDDTLAAWDMTPISGRRHVWMRVRHGADVVRIRVNDEVTFLRVD